MDDSREPQSEPQAGSVIEINLISRRKGMRKSRKPTGILKYHVPEEHWIPAKAHLLLLGNSDGKTFEFTKGTITANLALAERSKDSYEAHYRALRYFCCLIGIAH